MEKISLIKLRNFSYISGIGIPLVIGWILPKLTGHEFRLWTLFIGIALLIIGSFKPNKLLYPYKAWMKIGYLLGWFNSRIILSIIFFLILQPIALIMKLTGYDPLRLGKKNYKTFKEYKKDIKVDLTRIF